MLLTGCVPVIVTSTQTDFTPRSPTNNIEVFASREDVPYQFKDIGVIFATKNTLWDLPDKRLIDAMRKGAEEKGASAIIIMGKAEAAYNKRFTASAIVKVE